MRALHEQDHYEVLEVHRGAAPEDIERAYRAVRETYQPESLAVYSVFGDRDASVIRERIEEAYRILSDARTREAYDAATAGRRAPSDPAPIGERPETAVRSQHADAENLGGASEGFRELESEVEEETGEFDGAKLRRARLRRGFDLQQIADITKVSVAHLNRIEEEVFDELPATVYVRGFVIAYARTIGLDPDRVLAGYMARVEHVRSEHGRGRLRTRV